MTLTHNCNTPWADANTDPVEIDPHNGLTGLFLFCFVFFVFVFAFVLLLLVCLFALT